jgi:hypothetical protein
MQEMWPTRLPHPQETLRSLWLRRDYKAATLLMAKQEDQPDKNSLELQFFVPRLAWIFSSSDRN